MAQIKTKRLSKNVSAVEMEQINNNKALQKSLKAGLKDAKAMKGKYVRNRV